MICVIASSKMLSCVDCYLLCEVFVFIPRFNQLPQPRLRSHPPFFTSRIQVRYGSRWGPRHPNEIPTTTPIEILLSPRENITQINGIFGFVIDGVQLETTSMSYSWIGSPGPNSGFSRSGNKVIFVKGTTHNYNSYGNFVTQLTTVFDTCNF